MPLANLQVRRATVDDLVPLRRLWHQAGSPVQVLEKRLTEFQIVETAEGHLLGALGLKVDNKQGLLHTEVYEHAPLDEELRPRLWDRVQTVARHLGLVRLWMRNPTALFWTEKGFEAAGSVVLKRLPASFQDGGPTAWWTLQLREETTSAVALEQEMELLLQSRRDWTARLSQRARLVKGLATLLAASLFLLAAFAMWYVLRRIR